MNKKLKQEVMKNKDMVRKAAPVTVDSKSFAKLNEKMERICDKIRDQMK